MRGIRRSEDSFSVVMTDASGKLVRLDKRDLSDQRTDPISLMPGDYAQHLSALEIQNLVAYLQAQNGRDLSQDDSSRHPRRPHL